MNKKVLEIAKKIAEIEGVEIEIILGDVYHKGYRRGKYNPFYWSTLGPLMAKHEVDICNYSGWASIAGDYTDKPPKVQSYFGDAEGMPRAILECIIKSKELENE